MTHGGMAACRFLLVRPLAFSGFNGPMPSGVQRQFTAISNAWKGSGWEWFRCGPRRGSPEKSGRRRTHAHPQQNRRRSESLRSSRAPPRQPHGPALDRTPASPPNAPRRPCGQQRRPDRRLQAGQHRHSHAERIRTVLPGSCLQTVPMNQAGHRTGEFEGFGTGL